MTPNCIDVSAVQGTIQWSSVPSNIKYAFIKATQGHGVSTSTKNFYLFEDSKFRTNLSAASAKGIKCGVYHYLTATTKAEAKKEIDYFISRIAPYKSKITTYAAVDIEDPTYINPLSSSILTDIAKYSLELVAEAGFQPILYTNPNFLKYKFTPNTFVDTPIWLAHYAAAPYSVNNLKVWQFGTSMVTGICTQCDSNIFYETPNNNAEYHVACFRKE